MSIIFALAATITGPLRLYEAVDPITDSRSMYAMVGEQDANLAIGCEVSGKPETFRVAIHFDHYLGDATPGILLGGRSLTYRFDHRAPQSVQWSSHNRDVFAEPTTARPMKFALAMKGSAALYLRVADETGNSYDLSFSYPDPTFVIDNLLKRCGFNPDGHRAKK